MLGKMRSTTLMLAAIVASGAGYLLRAWQLSTALDRETELFIKHAPATIALVCFTLLLAGLLLLLLARQKGAPKAYEAAFSAPGDTVSLGLSVISGFLFFAGAGMCARAAYTQYILWSHDMEDPKRILFPAVLLILTVLCVPAGVSALCLGRAHYRENFEKYTPVYTILPGFAALFWLIYIYQENSIYPQLLRFVWLLLGAVCITLACYFISAYAYDRPAPKLVLFCSLLGILLSIMSLADGLAPHKLTLCLAFSLYLAADAWNLLRNWFGPARPRRLLRAGGRMPRKDEAPAEAESPAGQGAGGSKEEPDESADIRLPIQTDNGRTP